MIPGCSTHVRVAVLAAMLAGCGREGPRPPTELERAIELELERRFQIEVHTRCHELVRACVARLPDGSELPIVVTPLPSGAWDWRIEGLMLDSAPVEAYLDAELAEMGARQEVRCAPRIRRVVAGERIECGLGGGGKAFITIRADGSTSIEIELDAFAAAARSGPVTAAQDEELSRASRELEAGDPGAEAEAEDEDQDADEDEAAAADLATSPPVGTGPADSR